MRQPNSVSFSPSAKRHLFGHVAIADFFDLGGADDQCGRAVPVRRDIAAADDRHRLGLAVEIGERRAGRGFLALADKGDEVLAEFRRYRRI